MIYPSIASVISGRSSAEAGKPHEIFHTPQRRGTHRVLYPPQPHPRPVQRSHCPQHPDHPLLCAPAHVGAEAGRTAARHERAGRPALSREPSAITLPDICQAAEGDKPLLHPDVRTNPACGAGVNIRLAPSCCCAEVQQNAEARMAEIALPDILRIYEKYVRGNEGTK